MGYWRAGFDIIGVDKVRQPRYPFPFIKDDAIAFLDWVLAGNSRGSFDAVHASPPCQAYSKLANANAELGRIYPRLIEPTRERLLELGLPYVLENVPGAPLKGPVTLCGSQFGLVTWWPGKGRVGLRRHRIFETNWLLPEAGPHDHSLYSVAVYGHGASGKNQRARGKGAAKAARDVMQIDWMIRDELDEAIPPAYTEYVGGFLFDVVARWELAA